MDAKLSSLSHNCFGFVTSVLEGKNLNSLWRVHLLLYGGSTPTKRMPSQWGMNHLLPLVPLMHYKQDLSQRSISLPCLLCRNDKFTTPLACLRHAVQVNQTGIEAHPISLRLKPVWLTWTAFLKQANGVVNLSFLQDSRAEQCLFD